MNGTEYPTASAHPIARYCVGAALIPIRHPRRTQDGDDGTAAHAANLPAMAGLAPFPDTKRGQWLERRVGVRPGSRIEVAIAINPRTMEAMKLGEGLERDYSACPPGWIAMTLDQVDLDAGTPYFAELKTGGMPVPAPSQNAQIQTQALGVWRLTDRFPTVRLIHAKEGGTGFWQWWKPTFKEMNDWRLVLVEMMDAIDAQRGRAPDELDLTPGPHCHWCDRRRERVCPAVEPYMLAISDDPIDEHHAALVAAQDAKDRQADVYSALVDHPDVEVKLSHRRKMNTELAIEALPGLAQYSRRVVDMAGLDAYIGDHKQPGQTWRDAREEVEAKLFDAGALTYTTSESLDIPSNDSHAENVSKT